MINFQYLYFLNYEVLKSIVEKITPYIYSASLSQ